MEGSAVGKTTFRQIDVGKYVVTFSNTDQHTPDLIAWELKERSEHQHRVAFAETKKLEGVSGNTIELEIHLKEMFTDVPALIHAAAKQSADGLTAHENAFERALLLK